MSTCVSKTTLTVPHWHRPGSNAEMQCSRVVEVELSVTVLAQGSMGVHQRIDASGVLVLCPERALPLAESADGPLRVK